MFSHVTQKNYDLQTPNGRYNILEAIDSYHANLNNLQAADTSMSAVTAVGLLLIGAGVPYSTLATICSDVFLLFSMRNPRDNVYQDELAVLIHIYSECLQRGKAKVTKDPLFLKVMQAIAPNLTKEQGKKILTPEFLKSEYAEISPEFKAILAKAPHSRELEIISLPKNKGWLDYFWKQEESKSEKPTVDAKKTDEEPSASWSDNIHSSAVWCKLYGYKPKTAGGRSAVDVKAAVASVKSMALQQLVK